jgi:AGCS family alanine or glycine:cation symporter
METLNNVVDFLNTIVWSWGIPIAGETIPFVVIALLGTGVFLAFKLRLIQVRKLAHGFAVTSGKYDDPNEPGDVSHFQALTTALSATVGIGNIAGVAMAIHWGGPGALFWMWVTAFFGMGLKYVEVTLAQHFRQIEKPDLDPNAWEGSVSGGPMYYIERGLGAAWKPMAMFFAGALLLTSFLTGNGVQSNTVADAVKTQFGLPVWLTGLVTACIVSAVILGGIGRIGKVTGILAPVMAAIYVSGAMIVVVMNFGEIVPTFGLIFREAFNPTAGVAGTGMGALLMTLMWGVRRGLFSNEAGQGSAPIAHAAAKTDEPVSEGVVALLEPFIDTIVICTMTGLVILMTGVWNAKFPTELVIGGGDSSYVTVNAHGGMEDADTPTSIRVEDGRQADGPQLAWHEVAVERLFVDAEHTRPFSGSIEPGKSMAVATDDTEYTSLFGEAVEAGAPLTQQAFRRGLAPLGDWGHYIVILSVILFGISTAISWSYYGDRCANYMFGKKAIMPYKVVYIIAHFLGAIVSLSFVWTLGDVALGIVILPNLIAVVMLSGLVVKLTNSYFERKPWLKNAEDHKQWVAEHKK